MNACPGFSSALAPEPLSLELRATRLLPRRLRLTLHHGDNFSCSMYAPGKYSRRMLFATSKFADARLDLRGSEPSLWIGGAALELAPDEIEQVEKTFLPAGLRIQRECD